MRPSLRQHGAVLLFMIALLLAGSGWALSQKLAARTGFLEQERKQSTAQALQVAKMAVIAHAATAATPGQMPCPEDLSAAGSAAEGQSASCSNTRVSLGRLPWRSLGLGDLKDGNGDRLWYALSPGFRSAPINSNSTAGLSLDGHTGTVVAILFSPGRASSGQQRSLPSATSPLLAASYLDGLNASGGTSFSSQENDVLLPITLADLMPAVERRVLSEVGRALWVHYCGVSNWAQGGGCLGPSGGTRAFPHPAAASDTGCLGTTSIAYNSGKCPSLPGTTVGRIPATLSPMWNEVDTTSPLRGVTGSTGDWFQRNGWRELIFYSVAPACVPGNANCGGAGLYLSLETLQGGQTQNLKAVILSAGRAMPGQVRSSTALKTSLGNYLEGNNLGPTSGRYTSGSDASRNDLGRGLP